jgi:1-acyl-sn-glycerol-3-phosphate acyltransferase
MLQKNYSLSDYSCDDEGKFFEFDKSVVIAVPHTSNWDFIYCLGFFYSIGRSIKFTIKSEWMKFPFKNYLKNAGALPIDRNSAKGTVEQMVDMFNSHDQLTLVVTAEGTRSKRTKWKSGFYWAAHGAGVPIQCGFIDYKNKKLGIFKNIMPTGDFERDMKEIMDTYREVYPKFPEKFSLDERFCSEK